MNQYDKERVDSFFSTIKPWKLAYTNAGFSFFAIQRDKEIYLIQGRLFLNIAQPAIQPMRIETASLIAGHIALSELKLNVEQFVDAIANAGGVDTPFGKLIFPTREQSDISLYFEPFHQDGIATGNRLPVLTLSGAQKQTFLDSRKIDWELKSLTSPYDSVDEVLTVLALGGERYDAVRVEIIAYTVASINQRSSVNGTNAKLCIALAKTLNTNKCRIGYRAFLHGKVVSRGSLEGPDLDWADEGDVLQGEGLVGVQEGAVLHCTASYDGHAQHQWWVADPAHSQNARRVALEASDERLTILNDFLFGEINPRKHARDLEFGVAWLMWMLGFNVTQAGGTERSSDAPDILATSPQGNLLVVECTTGILKAQNKLANLVERTEVIRKRMTASGNGHLKLLPVIVTSKTKEEVKGELQQAEQSGVAVATRETLEELLRETIALPNTEEIYMRGWQSIQLKPDYGMSVLRRQ